MSVRPHPLADSNSFFGHGFRVRDVMLHDRLEQLVFVFPVERRLRGHKCASSLFVCCLDRLSNYGDLDTHLSSEHFIEQNPKGPPVHRLPIGLIGDDL